MLTILLPLLGVGALAGAPDVIVTGNHETVERALNVGVRSQIDAGWSVADIRSENEELVVTLVKGDAVERHVMHFDDKVSYRVVPDAVMPADAAEPSELTLNALSAPRGGIEITASCGDYYEVPYLVDDAASGEFAGTLVARTLATASDLRSASVHAGRATFVVERGGAKLDLLVWLDPKGKVIEAELRRFMNGGDDEVVYKRVRAMKAALGHTRVVGIEESASRISLKTSKGRYVINPDGDAFLYPDDGEYEGCGC